VLGDLTHLAARQTGLAGGGLADEVVVSSVDELDLTHDK
jgi:hypothetical protein